MAKRFKQNSFEEALKSLEDLVESLEKDELSLEESLEKYEEGIKLYRFCMKKLSELEGKIEVLVKELNGDFSRKEFDILEGTDDLRED